jgi:hypothetical protein
MAQVQPGKAGNGSTTHVEQMLKTHPGAPVLDRAALLACIEACLDCAQACTACADACLGEQDVNHLVRCIRLNQDCANVCEVTGKLLSRQTAYQPALARAILESCVLACRECAAECEQHAAKMEHCRVCAEACRRCEQACARLLSVAAA